MKKYSILFMLLTIIVSCNSQERRDKDLIIDFVKSIILKDSVTTEKIVPFINENTDISNNSELIELQINLLKNQLLNKDFSVLTYNEFKSKNEYNDYFIRYTELDNVYCLVCNKKYITLFVIEGNKILSFFTGIIKDKNRIFPYLL